MKGHLEKIPFQDSGDDVYKDVCQIEKKRETHL